MYHIALIVLFSLVTTLWPSGSRSPALTLQTARMWQMTAAVNPDGGWRGRCLWHSSSSVLCFISMTFCQTFCCVRNMCSVLVCLPCIICRTCVSTINGKLVLLLHSSASCKAFPGFESAEVYGQVTMAGKFYSSAEHFNCWTLNN